MDISRYTIKELAAIVRRWRRYVLPRLRALRMEQSAIDSIEDDFIRSLACDSDVAARAFADEYASARSKV